MATSRDTTSSEPPLVGFEIDKRKILSALLDTSEKSLSVVHLFGGHGVGKTFLAKNIYTSAEVQRHFDVHVWLPGHVLRRSEKCMWEQLSIDHEANISYFLRGKRYCVVLDRFNDQSLGPDQDSLDWYSTIQMFPNDSNGSRVLVTGQLGYHIYVMRNRFVNSLPKLYIEVDRRSDTKGLEILLKEAFPKDPLEGCPAGTVDALVMECQGLPWPLRFLGGLLSERPWNEVLGRIEAIKAAGKSFVDFAMSYRFLLSHEHRAAFLYFLTFPEDAEIHAKSLARKLEVEGIDIRKFHILEDLAQRSMIEVMKRYSDGSIKCCRLHDPFLRLLAIHEAKEKRFVHAYNSSIVDLFDAKIQFSSSMVKKNHKFGGKSMNVAQLADVSCIFNFGESSPLQTASISDRVLEIDDSKFKVNVPREVKTALISDRVLEIDDSKFEVNVPREVKKMGELKYLGLNNLRLLSEIMEIKEWDKHLTTLVVRDTTTEILPSNELLKMGSLEHLSLGNTKMREIPKIPKYLKTLDVRGTPIKILPEWIGSSKLISLILRNTKVCEIPKLPESLNTLDIGGAPIETLPNASLCPNVTTLVLKNTKVREIPESFTELKYLDVRNTFVRSLPDSLWSKLRSVLATDTLQHLDGPPPKEKYDQLETLETVHVTKQWGKRIPYFNWVKKLGLACFNPGNALDWNIIAIILRDLHNLCSLKIQGNNIPATIIDTGTCRSYLDKLKYLSVGGSYSLFSLRGIDLPPFLITLTLDNLEFDEDPMPILGELEQLESLQLRWLLYTPQDKKMNCSNNEGLVVFSKLKRLQLSHISGLEELSVQEGALPRITNVVIESCRDLKNLSKSLVHRTEPLEELHLNAMPTRFTRLFSGLPFVKITKNQI